MPAESVGGAVYFYHVTRRPVDLALSQLLGRALEAGWRVTLRCGDAAARDRLDDALWTADPPGFLPHGRADLPDAQAHPIVLTTDTAPVPDRPCLMAVAGAVILTADMAGLARGCVIFDGTDETAVAAARGQWRSLTGADIPAQYWSEESGAWVRKAQSPAPAT